MSKTDYRKLDNAVVKILNARNRELSKSYEDVIPELRSFYSKISEEWAAGDKIAIADINKYNRYGKTVEEIDKVSKSVFASVVPEIEDDLRGVYALSYGKAGEIATKVSGNALKGVIGVNTIDKALRTPVGGLTIDLRFERLRADLTQKLTQSVTAGIQRGDNWKKIAQDIRVQTGKSNSNLARIVQTEGLRLEEEAKQQSAEQNGMKFKTWVSEQDDRVRDAHAILNGEKIPINDDFTSPTGAVGFGPHQMGDPADDINCRCWLVYSMGDEKDGEPTPKKISEIVRPDNRMKLAGVNIASGQYRSGVNLEGITSSVAKEIKSGVEQVGSKYKVSLNGLNAIRGGRDTARYGAVDYGATPLNGTLQFAKSIVNKTDDWVATNADKYVMNAFEGVQKAKAVAIHETFHAVSHQNELLGKFEEAVKKFGVSRADRRSVSEYSTRNFNEFFSEVGTSLEMGLTVKENVAKAFKETVKKALL